jgi:hypothetical protein
VEFFCHSQEIAENLLAIGREDGFRMELNSLNWIALVLDSHEFVFLS